MKLRTRIAIIAAFVAAKDDPAALPHFNLSVLITDAFMDAVEQDHDRPELLFVGAERGIHVSIDGGTSWHRLAKNMPTFTSAMQTG